MTRVKSPTLRHARQCYIRRKDVAQILRVCRGAGPGERLVTRGKRKTVRVSGDLSYRDRLNFQFATLTHSY